MAKQKLTNDQVAAYHRDGYLIVRNFFSAEEISKLYNVAIEDSEMKSHSIDLNDQSGKKTRLALWFTPGDDVYGLLARSERIVDAVDRLMEGDASVCHYHSKLMQKEPRQGGAWEWHQDYGYWYKHEFLFPDQMISVMVAVTEANKANGCLQVIKGSHIMGRVEHGLTGDQAGASQRHVELALESMELVYVELKPGDTLLFHPNILHRSEANLSDTSRWSLISAYNRQSNTPYKEKSTSCRVPVQKVPDESLLQAKAEGLSGSIDFAGKNRYDNIKE